MEEKVPVLVETQRRRKLEQALQLQNELQRKLHEQLQVGGTVAPWGAVG